MYSKPELKDLLEKGSKLFSFTIGYVEYSIYHYPGDGFQHMVSKTSQAMPGGDIVDNHEHVTTQQMSDLMGQMQQGLQKINHMLRMIEQSGSEDVNG